MEPKENGISGISTDLQTFPAKGLQYESPWDSNWQLPVTTETDLQPVPTHSSASTGMQQAQFGSAYTSSKVRFGFQNLSPSQAWLKPIPSPVEGAEFGFPGCFFIKLQNRFIQPMGNKITPQFSLSSPLHMCAEALTQLHSHHLLTPALQLFGPMNLYITILTSGHYTCKIKYSSLILDKN